LTAVLYFRQVAEDRLREQVAVNADNIRDLQREGERTRERLHKLESDRAAVGMLRREVQELQEALPNLARRAAREAVAEYLRQRRADTLSNWRTYAALLSAGAALGGLVVAAILGAQ
jgi:hypothetical protein